MKWDQENLLYTGFAMVNRMLKNGEWQGQGIILGGDHIDGPAALIQHIGILVEIKQSGS